jgi:hypothetical protein
VREAAAFAAILYVLVYVLAQAWSRRSPARVVVICPLRSPTVPQEILERFGPPSSVEDLDRFARAEFTIGYLTSAPGIAVASVTDEGSLDEKLGPILRNAVFAPEREHCAACLRDRKWNAVILCHLALEVLHRARPRSLLVDFRPPSRDRAQAHRISTTEPDVDIGMHAYEIFCRLRRYSRYRDATFLLIFAGESRAWWFKEPARSDRFRLFPPRWCMPSCCVVDSR